MPCRRNFGVEGQITGIPQKREREHEREKE